MLRESLIEPLDRTQAVFGKEDILNADDEMLESQIEPIHGKTANSGEVRESLIEPLKGENGAFFKTIEESGEAEMKELHESMIEPY